MSFSSEIKGRISTIENPCPSCDNFELAAMVFYCSRYSDEKIIFSTENEDIILSVKELLQKKITNDVSYTYSSKSRLFEIIIDDDESIKKLFELVLLSKELEKYDDCCKSAYIRGAFLGGGSISDPHKSYHLEFDSKYEPEAKRLQKTLEDIGITSKITSRKKRYIVYVKEYEAIADVLGVLGDTNAAFDIYNISIEKELKNNINRQMNCENANMDKIADAYKKHLAAIEKIKKTQGLSSLPKVLEEIAQVRMEYPEDSLKQLGQRLDNPIGKSGVNHRLNRIVEIADSL